MASPQNSTILGLLSVKANLDGDLRRFSVQEKSITFAELLKTIHQVFHLDGSKKIKLTFKEEASGVDVEINSDATLHAAIEKQSKGSFKGLRVQVSLYEKKDQMDSIFIPSAISTNTTNTSNSASFFSESQMNVKESTKPLVTKDLVDALFADAYFLERLQSHILDKKNIQKISKKVQRKNSGVSKKKKEENSSSGNDNLKNSSNNNSNSSSVNVISSKPESLTSSTFSSDEELRNKIIDTKPPVSVPISVSSSSSESGKSVSINIANSISNISQEKEEKEEKRKSDFESDLVVLPTNNNNNMNNNTNNNNVASKKMDIPEKQPEKENEILSTLSSSPIGHFTQSIISLFKPKNNNNKNNKNPNEANNANEDLLSGENNNEPVSEDLLKQLKDMGFEDREANIRVLRFHKQFNGDITEIVEELLAQQNANKKQPVAEKPQEK